MPKTKKVKSTLRGGGGGKGKNKGKGKPTGFPPGMTFPPNFPNFANPSKKGFPNQPPNLPKDFMKMFPQFQKNSKTKQNNQKENSFGYYVRDRKSYKSSDKTSKGSTIRKHLKHLSTRVKKSYKLVSKYRDDYAQTTRTRLETANKAVKDVYMYLKNKDKREKKKRGKRSRKSNSNNSSSSSD